MGERFNGGNGGYTCDHCSTLLWAGIGGAINPEKRRFIYSVKPEDVFEKLTKKGRRFFCAACQGVVDKPKGVREAREPAGEGESE